MRTRTRAWLLFVMFFALAAPCPVAAAEVGILAGADDPCDAFDNDDDGTVDEGCDLVCDNSAKEGADIRITYDAGGSATPSLVWNGAGFGVAWNDSRAGDTEIYFARMTSNGSKIGSDVRVSVGADSSWFSSLVWTGEGYGVAWQDSRHGDAEIYFARLDADGSVVGSEVRVTSSTGTAYEPSLVWNGAGYGLAWWDTRDGNSEIYFARLDETGTKVGSDVRVTNDAHWSIYPALTWRGTGYGLAWEDDRDGNYEIYFARMDETGTKVGSDVRVTNDAGYSELPSLVSVDNNFGVAWVDYRDGNAEIYFARLASNGAKVGSDVRITSVEGASWWPSLVWNHGEYGIAWRDERDGNQEVYFARVSSAGAKVGSDIRVTSDANDSNTPSLAWTGTEYAVAWNDTRAPLSEIFLARLGCCPDRDGDGWSECAGDPNDSDPEAHPGAAEVCDGDDDDGDGAADGGCDRTCDAPQKVGSDVGVTTGAPYSTTPSLAWNGDGYGSVWVDQRDGNAEIYFARLDRSGNKVGSDVRVTSDPGSSVWPSLAWTGSEYGLAWVDNRDGDPEVYFVRLNENGNKVLADIRLTNASGNAYNVDLVWTGSEFGLVWDDNRGPSLGEVYFARVDALGNKLGGDVKVSDDQGASSIDPSIAWTGSYFGIAWKDLRDTPYGEIYFARLDPLGNKSGAEDRLTFDVSHSGDASLVAVGSGYGLAWQDARDGNSEIYFVRLSQSGTKLGDDVRVTDNTAGSSAPSLVFTGTQYGVAWTDGRSGNDEIYFATLDGSGNKQTSDIRVTYATGTSWGASLAWSGDGYGMAWQDDRNGSGQDDIYFAALRCCDDVDADGYTECGGDSDDADAGTHPGATEVCDGKDNDSDGQLDEGCDRACDTPGVWDAETRVTSASGSSMLPSLVWTGSEHGIVWHDARNSSSWDIYAARLTASGAKIGSDVRVTSNLTSYLPDVTWAGSEYGIAFEDGRDGVTQIYFARLDASGAKIGSDVRVTWTGTSATRPSIAWSGSEYGVAWQDNRDGKYPQIYFARLSPTGMKITGDARVTGAAGSGARPSLVATGSGYGVAWVDERDGNQEIYFARLDALGTRLGTEVRVTNDTSSSDRPALAWTGTEYGVAWADARLANDDIYFARLDAAGTKIGGDVRVTDDAGTSASPSLDWTGTEYAVAWEDTRDGTEEIYFARLDATGAKIGTEVRGTTSAGHSQFASLVWTGSEHGIAFGDDRNTGNWEIYFARMRCCDDADGDLYTECEDCDDSDPDRYPGATELCDGIDNDCDGAADDGWPVPAGVTGLVFASDKQTMSWPPVASADRYDVVKGDTGDLRSSGGNFTTSLLACLRDDTTTAAATDAETPPRGGGFYYLARAQAACKDGTYDSGAHSQVGSRDEEIDKSAVSCP